MAKKLNTFVHAVERDDKGEITNQGTFGPDDDLSKPENAWVVKAVTNPDVWEGSERESSGSVGAAGAADAGGSGVRAPSARPSIK